MTMSEGQVSIIFLCTTCCNEASPATVQCWWPICDWCSPKRLCYFTLASKILENPEVTIFGGRVKGGLQGRLLGEYFFAHLFPSSQRELSVLLASLNRYSLILKEVTYLTGKSGKNKADTHCSSAFFSFLGVNGLQHTGVLPCSSGQETSPLWPLWTGLTSSFGSPFDTHPKAIPFDVVFLSYCGDIFALIYPVPCFISQYAQILGKKKGW